MHGTVVRDGGQGARPVAWLVHHPRAIEREES
jgi:hypothetical protein